MNEKCSDMRLKIQSPETIKHLSSNAKSASLKSHSQRQVFRMTQYYCWRYRVVPLRTTLESCPRTFCSVPAFSISKRLYLGTNVSRIQAYLATFRNSMRTLQDDPKNFCIGSHLHLDGSNGSSEGYKKENIT